MGMSTSLCFRMGLRWRGGHFGLVSFSLPFLFFFSLFVFFSISSLFAVMTIQRDQDLRTVSFVFSHMYQLRHLRIFAPLFCRVRVSSGGVPAIDQRSMRFLLFSFSAR